MPSGSALNTSGLTTLPSCIGAMVKPVGRAQDGDVLALRLACSAPRAPPRGRSGTARRWRAAAPDSLRPRTARAARSAARRSRRPCPWQAPWRGHAAAAAPWAGWGFRNCRRRPSRMVSGASAAFGPRCALTAVLLPEAGGPEHEHVEVVALDVGAELDGLERTILADQAGDGVQLVGGLEAERGRIDHTPQLGCLQAAGPWRPRTSPPR